MKLSIRAANLDSDEDLLIATLARHLNPLFDASRFDWLYRDNPHGQGRAWIAADIDTGEVVGASGAFPRRLYVNAREELGWVLGDFCISSQYRSLGPALQLLRASLDAVDPGGEALCYDFPSTTMMALYRRLGVTAIGDMIRLAKPLRIDRKAEEIVESRLMRKGVTIAGNALLSLFHGPPRPNVRLDIAAHDGRCQQEFTDLAQEINGRYGICIQRSADYLNWRYLDCPLFKFEMLTARRDGTLVGYLVYTVGEEDGVLVDLFGHQETSAIGALVDRAVSILKDRGVQTVSAPLLNSHPWFDLLRGRGFRGRESGPVIAYRSLQDAIRPDTSETSWFLMLGDRDS